MIKKISENLLEETFLIIKEVTNKMNSEQIFQWDDIYPTKEILLNDIKNNSLYGFYFDNVISGFVVLNEEMPIEYNNLSWIDKDNKHLIIHRLSVKPAFQRKGIGKHLIEFAEKFARENNYSSIRLDAFNDNKIALNLYEKLDYKKKGVVDFRKGKFICYEKVL